MSFCLYNKKNITRRLEDLNFIFEWQNNILRTSAASSNKTFANNFANEPTSTDVKSKVFIAHVLQFSSLSPALKEFLDSFTNLKIIINGV